MLYEFVTSFQGLRRKKEKIATKRKEKNGHKKKRSPPHRRFVRGAHHWLASHPKLFSRICTCAFPPRHRTNKVHAQHVSWGRVTITWRAVLRVVVS
jgi:hypothetical protein